MQLHRTHTQASASYTDLNRLNALKVGEDRDSEENIRKVAKEFESLFIAEMLKAMRSANDVLADDSLFNSNESKAYRDMHDQQLSVTLAEGRGMGMADVLVRQMTEMNNPRPKPNPFPDMQKNVEPVEAQQQENVEQQVLRRRHIAAIEPLAARQQNAEVQAFADARATSPLQAINSYAAVSGQTEQQTFASPQEFVAAMLPMAQQAAQKLGIEPRYLVAQAALETGWGKNMPRDAQGNPNNNLFGIKAHGWQGRSVQAPTSEYVNGKKVQEQAEFRQYASFAHSFDDYVAFLQGNKRYQSALQATANPEQYIRELQRAGYATDPQYAQKISSIAKQIDNEQRALAQTAQAAYRG